MPDSYKSQVAECLGDEQGEPPKPTGRPAKEGNVRHGKRDQVLKHNEYEKASGESDASAAQREQDRQLKTGEENPG